MRQCPDCEEKDRVVIAGKVFCANCGTPWEPANKTETEPYLVKVGLSKPPTIDVGSVVSTPAPASPPVVDINGNSQSTNLASATPSTNQAQANTLNTSAQSSFATQPGSSAPTNLASVTGVAPTSVPASATPQPLNSTAPDGVNSLASNLNNPVQSTNSINPIIQPITDTSQANNLGGQIGSEIPNLDSKDESVLSDAEFQNMAQAPAMMPPLTSTSQPSPPPQVNDLPTPQSPPIIDIPPAASAPPPPTPPITTVNTQPVTIGVQTTTTVPAPQSFNPAAPSVDGIAPTNPVAAPTLAGVNIKPAGPTPIPPAIPESALTSTTVAGVTMSRDAALKLALGEEPTANVSPQKSGPARPVAVVISVIALVMLGAYLFQSNYPALALKMAGMRSGMDVSVPSYLPNGWSISRQITSSQGSVAYTVNKSNQSFKITEQKSDWDSQALLEQTVLPKTADYLALQAEGLTIYIFGDNQATWVNSGTVYNLEGSHGLSQDEIIRIATSL